MYVTTHGRDGYEGRDTGAVVAEAGDTAVVGGGREEAGDGHNMGRNSNGLLKMGKIKDTLSNLYLFCLLNYFS